jgi:hypothetical protein
VTLLSTSITITAGSTVVIWVGAGISNTNMNNNMSVRLSVDGVVRRAFQVRSQSANVAAGGSIGYVVTGLAAGARTILLEWKTAGNTAQCRPTTNTDGEFCTIIAQEVTV